MNELSLHFTQPRTSFITTLIGLNTHPQQLLAQLVAKKKKKKKTDCVWCWSRRAAALNEPEVLVYISDRVVFGRPRCSLRATTFVKFWLLFVDWLLVVNSGFRL